MDERITPAMLKVFVAVLALRQSGRDTKVRTIMRRLGYRSPFAVGQQLDKLKAVGLIESEPHTAGTVRPLYRLEIRK